ncbi:fumarylacetoacetate hydrolase family protein [Natronospira bacteriovora]|uniref:Fumarylacetoacetate hydrolase family protein n=1 Tax=Natronospira bacteriovora TaxID=3069753 RepID=A0ABU0W8A8_9GAMM|nr:fumarylacetoacetate hydrolase family protein [Natronospira sp. AB-CW4]MDQ2070231.1 fumarylacetoacetate hydrolase family protein [Natronospira sp. AB-CW4]
MTASIRVTDASRLFCVGRNYADHAREMGAERPAQPVFFHKPGSVRQAPGTARLPFHLGRLDFEGELALLLSGETERPIAGLGLAVDLTLRDEQSRLKAERLPWDVAKAFDGSALLGDFHEWHGLPGQLPPDLGLETWLNGECRQRGTLVDMLFSPADLLPALSRYWRPRAGDVVLTGTPAGVGPLAPGDVLEMKWRGLNAPEQEPRWRMEAMQ